MAGKTFVSALVIFAVLLLPLAGCNKPAGKSGAKPGGGAGGSSTTNAAK